MPKRPATKPAAAPVEDIEEELEIDETEDVEVEDTADEEPDTDVEVEDDAAEDDDDLEVEDSDDEEEAPAPAKKTRAKKAAGEATEKPAKVEIQFGSAWLAEHVNKQTGSTYNAFGIRTLLRKLVKDGVVQRDVGTDRSRYSFEGPTDPTVKAVVKAIKDGSAAKAKAEKIEEAKSAAAKKTAKTAAKPAAKKGKAAPEPEVEAEDDEDIEDL